MAHLCLNNSRDAGEAVMEVFIPLVRLVRLNVWNEKSVGERAVYRDGPTFFCSGPSRCLWSTVVLVDFALPSVWDNKAVPWPSRFSLASLHAERDCVGLGFLGRGLFPCRGPVPESGPGSVSSWLSAPVLALGRWEEGRCRKWWRASAVRPGTRINGWVVGGRGSWDWRGRLGAWLWWGFDSELWRWRFGPWFGVWAGCGGCRRSPSVDARRFCDQL